MVTGIKLIEMMMRTRLLAGMRDKELSRELQLNVNYNIGGDKAANAH